MSSSTSQRPKIGDRIAEALLSRIARLGIHVTPFVTILEGATPLSRPPLDAEFRFSELTAADIKDLLELEPTCTSDKQLARFTEGKRCFGLWHGSRLVAKTWCDLEEITSPWGPRRLNSGEVYLFSAFSDPSYRGRDLAPALRFACYEALRNCGFTRFYSYSAFFNRPARRFKQKLGGVEQELRLHIGLLDRWSKTVTLKRYCH